MVCAALSITSLEGGALAENRPDCGALTGPAVGSGGGGAMGTFGEAGRVQGQQYIHTVVKNSQTVATPVRSHEVTGQTERTGI